MTKPDTNLLFLYSEKARARINDTAKQLKKSPQRIKYNLKMLEKEGIVLNPYCIFDYSYLGLMLFRVYFKGCYISEKDKSAIIRTLNENPYTVSVYEMTGEYDIAIEISAPNPSRFNKELRKLRNLLPVLSNHEVILNIVTYIYPRSYLPKNAQLAEGMREIIIGGDRSIISFSDKEARIMKTLLDSPRTKMTFLAKKSGLNVKTAKACLNDLSKRKVIRGFKHLIDTNKLGIKKSRLFLRIHNLTSDRESALNQFMLNSKEVVQVNKTVGDWDMEVDIEALDSRKSRQLIIQFRESFKDIIETFNIIEFESYHKRSYLPSYLFTEPAAQEFS